MSVRSGTVLPRTRSALPLSAGLRAATRDEHRQVEARLDLDRPLAPADVARVLAGWQAVWGEVRQALDAPAACATARAELGPLTESSLTALALDLDDRAAGSAASGPLLDLLAGDGAWGVAYVLHGARLGTAVLAPRVAAALAPRRSAYFTPDGDGPGRAWAGFRRRLDASGADLDDAAAAARWTFGRVGDLLAGRAA